MKPGEPWCYNTIVEKGKKKKKKGNKDILQTSQQDEEKKDIDVIANKSQLLQA